MAQEWLSNSCSRWSVPTTIIPNTKMDRRRKLGATYDRLRNQNLLDKFLGAIQKRDQRDEITVGSYYLPNRYFAMSQNTRRTIKVVFCVAVSLVLSDLLFAQQMSDLGPIPAGQYKIMNRLTHKCIGVDDGKPNSPLKQLDCSGENPSIIWKATALLSSSYHLNVQNSAELCMDVPVGGNNLPPIQQFPCNNGTNQTFTLSPVLELEGANLVSNYRHIETIKGCLAAKSNSDEISLVICRQLGSVRPPGQDAEADAQEWQFQKVTKIPPVVIVDRPQPPPRSDYFNGIDLCPEGYALRGLHAGNKQLKCVKTSAPDTDYFIDYGTQRSGMRACPTGTYVRGLQVRAGGGRNLLVCAYDRQRGETLFTGDEKALRCMGNGGQCPQEDGMGVCSTNPNVYVTGYDEKSNTLLCREAMSNPPTVKDPIKITFTPETDTHSYAKLQSFASFDAWQRLTRNWLLHILHIPTNSPPPTADRLPAPPFARSAGADKPSVNGTVRIQPVSYSSPVDETTINAYVLYPPDYGSDEKKTYAAVLVTHGHDVTVCDTITSATSPRQNGCAVNGSDDNNNYAIAYELAKAGAITLAVEVRGFGNYMPGGQDHNYWKNNLPLGDYPQMYLLDNLKNVSELLSIPKVDPSRTAVVGLSLGGYQAMWLGALDTRIRKVVVAGLYLQQKCLNNPNLHDKCQTVPAIKIEKGEGAFDPLIETEDLAALIAPRALLTTWGTADSIFIHQRDCREDAHLKTKQLYRNLKIADRYEYHEFAGKHVIDVRKTVDWVLTTAFY